MLRKNKLRRTPKSPIRGDKQKQEDEKIPMVDTRAHMKERDRMGGRAMFL